MTRRKLLGLSAAQGALLALSIRDCAAQAAAASAVVATDEGALRGVQGPKVATFRGVRYAEAQSSVNRFKPPIKLKPWQGVRDAIQNGPIAPQNIPQTNLSISAPLRSNDKWAEDCLTLNIFTPGTDKKSRAVMVWLHGGGYAFGSANLAPYDGTNLAAFGDVVVVTVNHRLNAFGFLQLPASAGPEYAQSGNVGMLDLVEALRWVKANIAAFGGDPGNVTIFGESGGGGKVSILTAMPMAKGLFHKAIIESGATLTVKPKEEAAANGAKLIERLGIKQISSDALGALTPEHILAAERDVPESVFQPILDGTIIPANPYDPVAPSISADVPILLGTNQTETTYLQGSDPSLFTLDQTGLRRRLAPLFGERTDDVIGSYEKTHPKATPSQLYFIISTDAGMRKNAILLAERKSALHRAPVFMYYLNWHTPVNGGKWMSPHLLDLPFVFRNLEQCVALIGQGDQQRELMERMSSAWVAFAKTGNPSNHKTGYWPDYNVSQRATMIFDGKSQAAFTPDEEDRIAIFGPRKAPRTGPPPE